MRRRVSAAVLVLLASSAAAMQSTEANRNPVVDRNFCANVLDVQGVSTQGQRISIEGKTFLTYRRGEATLHISFAQIKSIEFLGPKRDASAADQSLPVRVELVDGGQTEGTVEGRMTLFGVSNFGEFKIRLNGVRKVSFVADVESDPAACAVPRPASGE